MALANRKILKFQIFWILNCQPSCNKILIHNSSHFGHNIYGSIKLAVHFGRLQNHRYNSPKEYGLAKILLTVCSSIRSRELSKDAFICIRRISCPSSPLSNDKSKPTMLHKSSDGSGDWLSPILRVFFERPRAWLAENLSFFTALLSIISRPRAWHSTKGSNPGLTFCWSRAWHSVKV